jgi:hypothetical protein
MYRARVSNDGLRLVWVAWPDGTDIYDFEVHFKRNSDDEWTEVTRTGHPSDIRGLPGKIEVFFRPPT